MIRRDRTKENVPRPIKGRTLNRTIITIMRIVYFFLVTFWEIVVRNGGLVMMASI